MREPVDNTGNVREWPSEEILAFYLVQRDARATEKVSQGAQRRRVIELGAGKSGLVGLASACSLSRIDPALEYEVVITDGNERCVESLQVNVDLNPQFQGKVRACQLLWSRDCDPEPRLGKFD